MRQMRAIIEPSEQQTLGPGEEEASADAASASWIFRPDSTGKSVIAEMKKDGGFQWKATALD